MAQLERRAGASALDAVETFLADHADTVIVAMAQLAVDEGWSHRRHPRRGVCGQRSGAAHLEDIVAELRKPGRDPRASFEPPKFRDDVDIMADLKIGMQLHGVVTNVTAFGAFVDIGVHQDGLVHVSQLADKFVKNPADVVKPGERISVRVLEIDLVHNASR